MHKLMSSLMSRLMPTRTQIDSDGYHGVTSGGVALPLSAETTVHGGATTGGALPLSAETTVRDGATASCEIVSLFIVAKKKQRTHHGVFFLERRDDHARGKSVRFVFGKSLLFDATPHV